MHHLPHALLYCVASFSLLRYGNAAKGIAPSEVLTHFAHTVGTVLVPTLANELHSSRTNRSTETTRRQIEPRQAPAQNAGAPNSGVPFAGQNIPYQYERTYQYRYPPYTQHVSQTFFPGNGGFTGQPLPVDPRFFQAPIGGQSLAPIQPEIPKPINDANGNNNGKDNVNNANSIQNLEPSGDSKSSAQSRPYDGSDFSSGPGGPNQPGSGNIGRNGNLRVDNRFSAIDYERIRQNYYSDPPIDQRNYFNSFNEIPFNGGPPYRSPLSERYSNLNYNGAGGGGGGGGRPGFPSGPSGDLRSNSGIGGLGDPYFGNFFQGPYQSPNYNNLPGSGESGLPFDGFDRSSSFRSPFDGSQYPGGFNGQFYPGQDNLGGGPGGPGGPGGAVGPGFGDGDSSLRATSAKETVSDTTAPRDSQENSDKRENNGDRLDKDQKIRFVNANGKHLNTGEKARSSQA